MNAPEQARIVITLLDAKRSRRVLSVGTRGQVQEFELRYELPYFADDGQGHQLLEQQSALQTRSFSFDETDVVAKSNEEDYLFRDMQRSAVMQIVRRIPAISAKLHSIEAQPARTDVSPDTGGSPDSPPGGTAPAP